MTIPDITFKLAKENADMALFSPYDVERIYGKAFGDVAISELYDELVADDRIRKKYINARDFFQTLAEIQFESGYPYIMYEDTVNRANPIAGRINMSNLCSEILQVNSASAYDENGLRGDRQRYLLQPRLAEYCPHHGFARFWPHGGDRRSRADGGIGHEPHPQRAVH